jgi:hypothetical protein
MSLSSCRRQASRRWPNLSRARNSTRRRSTS